MNLWEKIKQGVQSVRKSAPPVEALELSRLQAEVEELRHKTKEEFTALEAKFTSFIRRKKLCEIDSPAEVLFGLIIRQGAALIPHHDTRIMAGDTVVLIGKKDAVVEILHKFKASDK